MQIVTDQLMFPEGPIAMPDGSVLVVEIRRGTLSRVDVDGTITVVGECGGGPNGAAIGPDGKVYVCNNGGFDWSETQGIVAPGGQPDDYIGGRIQTVDIDTGTVADLYTDCDGRGLRGPNDIVFDSQGGFYFTDLGKSRPRDADKGSVYYATADGRHISEIAFPMDHPNGIGLSPDGAQLYVAESTTARIWSWDVVGPGHIDNKSFVTTLPGRQYLDSLAIDSEGNVCVATIVTGAVTVVSPIGEVIDVVKVPEHDPFVTNICFGGEDLTTAYITSSGLGRLYRTDWARPGLRLSF